MTNKLHDKAKAGQLQPPTAQHSGIMGFNLHMHNLSADKNSAKWWCTANIFFVIVGTFVSFPFKATFSFHKLIPKNAQMTTLSTN